MSNNTYPHPAQANTNAAQLESDLLRFLDTLGESSYDPATGKAVIPDITGDNSFLAARILRENDESIATMRDRSERAAVFIAGMEQLVGYEVLMAQMPAEERLLGAAVTEHVTFAELMAQDTPGFNSARGFDIARIDYNGLPLFEN